MSIMDQVKKNLREWYSLAADRTGEMAKISVRMYDKYGISREIERQLSELGSYVYHAVEQGRTEFADDAEFAAWIERIKGLEQDLHMKVAEIDEIREARQQKQAQRERDEAEGVVAGEPADETAGGDEPAAEPAAEPDGNGVAELLEAEEAGPPPAASTASERSGAGADEARDLTDESREVADDARKID